MKVVVVERSFEEPVDAEALQAQEDEGAWCLETHRVKFVRTYLAKDRKRMLCLYQAPDAESVRIAQRTIEMPVDDVWSGTVLMPPNGSESGPGPISVIEREFEPPLSEEDVYEAFDKTGWCLEMYRVAHQGSVLSTDGKRCICFYEAPDHESARNANRKSGVPSKAMWPSTRIDAAT